MIHDPRYLLFPYPVATLFSCKRPPEKGGAKLLTFEAEMETRAKSLAETEPKLYYADHRSFLVEWIAEGTVGNLYLVPAEPGGWLRRAGYNGPRDELAAVRPEKARTIMWFVYGDVGPVTIVGS